MKDYDELLISLRRITRAIDLYSKRLQKNTNLTISQLLVMEAIVKIDKPTPSAIAKSILLSQATVTNLIDRLEKNELVQRKRLGTDKRTVNVVLTESGEAKFKEAPELLQSGFLTGISQAGDLGAGNAGQRCRSGRIDDGRRGYRRLPYPRPRRYRLRLGEQLTLLRP
jgi:DNA-binding MarR family transcriptional regulator